VTNPSVKPPGHPLLPHPTLSEYYGSEPAKRPFIRQIFDTTAGDYDRVERMMALGSGPWYRRQALKRAGLAPGMRVLDVAVGTGLVAREEIRLTGSPDLVIGLDPSAGMLAHAVRSLGIKAMMGVGEQLPVADATFDFLSMGYALRHLSDLTATFREFHRALKPGGRLCVLEISRPKSRVGYWMLKGYMRTVVPVLTRLTTRHADTQLLWRYYWDTIQHCVEPSQVMDSIAAAGFTDVRRHAELGFFSEFTARKPF
jgi:demethylmenaquinone methyltransferase/2-methoxy-6-polyprenyl-1,4-benzoquinol methylase